MGRGGEVGGCGDLVGLASWEILGEEEEKVVRCVLSPQRSSYHNA